MIRSRVVRSTRTPWRNLACDDRRSNEDGFTLIELIIVTMVMPIIIGAITLALISIFSIQSSTSNRITGSADAQDVSSNFESDVQGASQIIAPKPQGAPSGQKPATCGSGTEVMSLLSGLPVGPANALVYPTEISYVEVLQPGTTSSYTLVRNVCSNGSSYTTTPVSSSTVSYNVTGGQQAAVTCSADLSGAQPSWTGSTTLNVTALPASVSANDQIVVGSGSLAQTYTAAAQVAGETTLAVTSASGGNAFVSGSQVIDSTSWANSNCGAATAWITATDVTGVTLAVTEPSTGAGKGANPYNYSLAAVPRASAPPNPLTTVSTPTATKCQFATAGTGTYASSLCFVDFSPFNPALAYGATEATSPGCQEMAATIPGTSFTMQFCLQIWGAPVQAASFPTWQNAFLGNNGFYTGVSGNPALYQTGSGTTTVSITNVQVTDGNGNAATGWELVTGDAETTDAGESITWTSNAPFTLIPNTSTSQVGNACSDTTSPLGLTPPSILTGGSALTVECESSTSVSTPRTGTVMLGAPTPTTLNDVLVGGGLEGIFIGLLLSS
jgi:prepilin-type N-terminal cleavage/methylation domain-containing protein